MVEWRQVDANETIGVEKHIFKHLINTTHESTNVHLKYYLNNCVEK